MLESSKLGLNKRVVFPKLNFVGTNCNYDESSVHVNMMTITISLTVVKTETI